MANGAAGCGFEHRNYNRMMCGFLSITNKDETEFHCIKYHENLETHTTTKHPFRCTKCVKSV